jgi:predicted neutral ceramidase superfamily lipid hydrolase
MGVKVSKGAAFMAVIICIMLVFIIAALMVILGKLTDIYVAAVLTALVTMGTTYVGLQVANNGVRGKWFREEIQQIDEKAKEGEK